MELLVIFVIVVVVLGPQKTVLYARKLGKWLRVLKTYVSSFMGDFEETVVAPLEELSDPLQEVTKPLQELQDAVQAPVRELDQSLRDLKPEAPKPVASPEEPLEFAQPEEEPLEFAQIDE